MSISNPRQTVKDMTAQVEKGQTPALLEQFLRETFGGSVGGWFSRWLSDPRTYEVCRITPFEDGGFFRRSCVFEVFARDHLLEGTVLPSGGTFGLFSLDADGLHYLNHRREDVEKLLRGEERALNECAATVLASLVVEALGRERNHSHALLESPDQLANFKGELQEFGGGYKVNVREFDRVRARIVGPSLSGDTGSGWLLEFCTVFGWMHEKQKLIRHRCRFAPDFRIECDKDVLSNKIFKRTPGVRY